MQTPALLEATLAELPGIYDWPEAAGSPSNIWPDDRSWFVYSNYDLSGTRVSGSAELVASVVADSELETITAPGAFVAGERLWAMAQTCRYEEVLVSALRGSMAPTFKIVHESHGCTMIPVRARATHRQTPRT
jgi:hypothetical protein